ncbi:MAG: class I SAM-dependent methyltransferase [Blastocatellia bacterium]
MRRFLSVAFATFLLIAAGLARQAVTPRPGPRAGYLSYEQAQPLLDALKEETPSELRYAAAERRADAWRDWAARRDTDIRSRLKRGDEDSVVNFLLFGTSYTRHPRLTLADIARINQKNDQQEAAKAFELIRARADDLVQATLAASTNERVLFVRRMFEEKGYDLKRPATPQQLMLDLLTSLSRVLDEQSSYGRLLEAARMQGDVSQEFVVRSQLYKDRGLSSDTSLPPNFALERSLAALKARGTLAPRSVRRVAIVGPGLDFTDKQDGFDFYPQQTIQPFAVMDSLMRLGLARPNDLRVTTLDLSPRINDHLTRARARATSGTPYIVQLPRDEQWKPELLAYWAKFGDQIGTAIAPVAPPTALGTLKVRAVSIRPNVVSLLSSADVDIVLQHLSLAPAEQFDIIIATNILVYYDTFEQSLALANIEQMLRPGGLLLSNNALLEVPVLHMRSLGYESVAYSDREADGDHIVWYQRQTP